MHLILHWFCKCETHPRHLTVCSNWYFCWHRIQISASFSFSPPAHPLAGVNRNNLARQARLSPLLHQLAFKSIHTRSCSFLFFSSWTMTWKCYMCITRTFVGTLRLHESVYFLASLLCWAEILTICVQILLVRRPTLSFQ